MNTNLFLEVGSLLFLSFLTNMRGSVAKMVVETAIATRPQILASTRENPFCCSDPFSLELKDKNSMLLSMIMVTRSNFRLFKSLCQMNTSSALTSSRVVRWRVIICHFETALPQLFSADRQHYCGRSLARSLDVIAL